MKAYKSKLAKELLSNKETATKVRAVMEAAGSSRSNGKAVVTYRDNKGREKSLMAKVLIPAT